MIPGSGRVVAGPRCNSEVRSATGKAKIFNMNMRRVKEKKKSIIVDFKLYFSFSFREEKENRGNRELMSVALNLALGAGGSRTCAVEMGMTSILLTLCW